MSNPYAATLIGSMVFSHAATCDGEGQEPMQLWITDSSAPKVDGDPAREIAPFTVAGSRLRPRTDQPTDWATLLEQAI